MRLVKCRSPRERVCILVRGLRISPTLAEGPLTCGAYDQGMMSNITWRVFWPERVGGMVEPPSRGGCMSPGMWSCEGILRPVVHSVVRSSHYPTIYLTAPLAYTIYHCVPTSAHPLPSPQSVSDIRDMPTFFHVPPLFRLIVVQRHRARPAPALARGVIIVRLMMGRSTW